MSRPPQKKDPALLHDHAVVVRMTGAEHADAIAVSARLGISVSRLMRSRAEALPPSRLERDAAIAFDRIGVNLNQIAHRVNSGTHPELADIMPILDELRARLIDVSFDLRSRK